MAAVECGVEEAPLVGQMIGERYKVLSVLDRGGMGVIYRAEQLPIGRKVALKVLAKDQLEGESETFSQRFLMEASTCAQLSHPNTITLYDFGETPDGCHYIAMELLQGRNLQQVLDAEKTLDPIRTLHIVLQIAGSLCEAHEFGIVHRDLKPGNIFLTAYGDDEDFVKVLDFGLAKQTQGKTTNLTQQGLMVGSPRFMSPEQIRSLSLDGRSDIYSIGAIMYRCLTGRYVFDSEEQVNVILGHINEPPPPFEVAAPARLIPQGIEAVVMRCLAKNPDERYGSINELVLALEDLMVALEPANQNTTLRMSRPRAMAVAQQSLPDEVIDTGEHSLAKQGPVQATPARHPLPMVLALALVAIAFWWVGRSSSPVEVEPVAQPPVEEGWVEGAEEGNPPAAPSLVPLDLVTDPAGATVYRDGKDIGDTPLGVVIPEGESWELTVKLDGYLERRISVYGGQNSLSLRLKPQMPGAAPAVTVEKSPIIRSKKPKKPSRRPPSTAQGVKGDKREGNPPPSPVKGASELRDPWGE